MEKLYELASYASFIVYHIEAMDKIKIPKTMIREYINLQKTVGSYPKELNYVTSFYDKKQVVVERYLKTPLKGIIFYLIRERIFILIGRKICMLM